MRPIPPNAAGPFGFAPNLAAPHNPTVALERYDVHGERIRLQLSTGAGGTQIQDVTIDGQARFAQTQTLQPGDVPLVVSGEQIEVLRADAPDTGVTVSGKPAEVAARGLEMYGDVVRMDKGTNRVWIDGPGRMKLPESQPAARSPASGGSAVAARPHEGGLVSVVRSSTPADPLFITWKDRMTFDGSTAHFEHSIVGQSRSRKFLTDALDVSLRRRIDFAQPRRDERPRSAAWSAAAACGWRTAASIRSIQPN